MDQSYSESDVSISPSQILDRLQVLRQLQILQRGKLQKHRLQYETSPEISSSLTEIVSHFSNSTSYNTFRSLLQSSQETNDVSPNKNSNNLYIKENLQNVIEGVSVLNLSDESEFIANSVSPRNSTSPKLDTNVENSHNDVEKNLSKKQISLDEMPILSPKKDFETLITEKLKNEKSAPKAANTISHSKKNVKKTFLKRGEGMARFGLQKNDLVIQNTKSLPWKRKNSMNKNNSKTVSKTKVTKPKNKVTQIDNIPIQILEKDTKSKDSPLNKCSPHNSHKTAKVDSCSRPKEVKKLIIENKQIEDATSTSNNNSSLKSPLEVRSISLHRNKQTWASVLTKEQDDFLRQLKQSEYYKNFISPAKSTISDVSCNEDVSKLSQEREMAEQNLFDLIENKVMHESFNINNSFFNRFVKKGNLECSGESTPLVMQKCLYKNPNLMHILPLASRKRNDNSCSDFETCNSECAECSENCSTVSSCCSCQTTTQGNISVSTKETDQNDKKGITKRGQSKLTKEDIKEKDKSHNDTLTAENEMMNSNMAEMNAKLIATSELLKDRLKELEDEIETFRKENINLTKMREEVDMERQKLYEEKNAFEQKFNEEKILSEYHLAEEKEKLNKQKQMYDRYVREMRGRLSKKEKDEIVYLKKEIHDLKEEIKIKDAKSTSTIARLRNHIKIIEKDKKNLEDELEKLNKENRRIQHSNEITRRLTNLKYLEEINKKLSNMASKDSRSDVELDSNVKYKAFEIERQSRIRKSQAVPKGKIKQRAKSVPNLHVTSRYAKYFSQKDSISYREKNKTLSNDIECNLGIPYAEDNDFSNSCKNHLNNSELTNNISDSEEDNSLEKIYNERFKSISPEATSNKTDKIENLNRISDGSSEYSIEKNARNSSQKSLDKCLSEVQYNLHSRTSKSPSLPFSNRSSHGSKSPSNFFTENRDYLPHNDIDTHYRNKSPMSSLSNHSSSSHKSGTVINKVYCERLIPSPEPTSSKTSLSKTNLNPIEIKKPDGTRELRFPNGNVKIISADGKYSKFIYYNGDIKENFYNEGRIKYFYAETKTFHTTHPDGLEVLEFPEKRNDNSCSDFETCNSECAECSENCSTVSSCCSCQTTTQGNISVSTKETDQNDKKGITKRGQSKLTKEDIKEKDKSHNDTLTAENEMMNSNMAEMNAKLIATSELLKDRLKELEDEIETFRKENINLTKMREEVDMERQKLYEEKNAFEQKFNEEKILSEYHLAEEKEKLNKQKQMYDRYVREMRGRLSKKEKDEIVYLKKEIHDLKEEIKIKDAKSTSTIARLRNHIKIIEKDKKNLEDELEKLNKENRRIQHSNEITRRLTNLKYLEEINKKLSNMASKDSRSDVELDSNVKYKAFEIERQSRIRKSQAVPKGKIKQRAKSVPNLHVTSRYAKYFSQKDSISDREKNKTLSNDIECNLGIPYAEDNDFSNSCKNHLNNSELTNNISDSEEDNSLEKIYNERFKSISPEATSNKTDKIENLNRISDGSSEYSIEKNARNSSQKSLDKCLSEVQYNLHSRTSKSPSLPFSNRSSHGSKSPSNFFTENRDYLPHNDIDTHYRNKSPMSSLSNHSSSSHKSGTVINKVYCERLIPSPEPTSSKTSLSKTNLNPIEIKKPDGTRELRFPNGNVKIISADGKYSKFIYYNGDIKENFYNEGRIKYFYAETKTFHTTHPDGLEVLEFPDGQVEKRYKDGSSEIKLPNGSIRYYDPKNEHVREEWRFPDGASLTVSANGEQRIVFANGQVEVHAKDHKRREFPDGSVKLVYNDGTAETRYASGRVRIKDKHGNLIMDSAPG